jgi:alanyl-tRNA synthetase
MLLSANQLRQKYLDFFADKNHAILPSALLVPENDPTTLFTSAGMQSMMPYLLGQPHPKGKRIANSQKCFRAQDLDAVGDNRHTTFFEMLGNWSLGDYFKQEQLTWFFEFLTQELGLDPKRLYVSVFAGDERYNIGPDREAVQIWQELFDKVGVEATVVEDPIEKGLSNGRIFFYGSDKNWWSRAGEPDNMPVGEPGGPDSEVFYDFGPELKLHENSEFADQPCHINCDCGRFLEIGNSVFMQYQKTGSGFKELPRKNIDFGGGLERILAAVHNQTDIFRTELFWPILQKIEQVTGKKYKTGTQTNFRIIADHLKASTMLIADGVKPSNKEQGYVVRRLLRRAIRYSKLIDVEQLFLDQLVEPVVNLYQEVYPQLQGQQQKIEQLIQQESIKFEKTLNRGLREFDQLLSQKQELTGKLAFKLYETYGFPLEMSVEEAQRQKVPVSQNLKSEFKQVQKKHAQESRAGAQQKFKGGLADQSQITTAYHTATHLLHAALRQVLGDHVQQKGSNITDKRLRFDFSHPQALTKQELKQVETLINDWVKQDLLIEKKEMSKQQALNSGALSFFPERYPNQVTVYQIGQNPVVSKELCAGPHVNRTGEIGQIEIFKEKSASAGVRRIYARLVK